MRTMGYTEINTSCSNPLNTTIGLNTPTTLHHQDMCTICFSVKIHTKSKCSNNPYSPYLQDFFSHIPYMINHHQHMSCLMQFYRRITAHVLAFWKPCDLEWTSNWNQIAWFRAGIACWQCVALAVLLNVVSWVRSSLGKVFLVEGIFPLELTWALTPFPKNSFRCEYKPRSSLCTHAFHRMDSKDSDVHVPDGECRQQKHTQHTPSTKTECDYLNGWIKKRSHT